MNSKFREIYNCFKPRNIKDVNKKALSNCKYKSVFSLYKLTFLLGYTL